MEFSYGMKGVSKRATFVIAKEGIIRYAEILENPGGLPNFNLISKNLGEIA
jgi:glutaredoxin-dependent peroxiredoxin